MSSSSLDRTLQAAVDGGELAGVSATAWHHGSLVFEGAAGSASSDRAMAPDTIVWVASMTKAITTAAALQLVERGALSLDQVAGDLVPYLHDVQVLDGFDANGDARLRAPKRPVTLRHLLTHTSGFGYEWIDGSLNQYVATLPEPAMGSQAGFEHPLVFDPGEGWAYGIGVDWAGRVIEAASGQRFDEYVSDHILGPLDMLDTCFSLTMAQRARRAVMNVRVDGELVEIPFDMPEDPEMFLAGGGLFSTVIDYARFTRMILGRGNLDGVRILEPHSIELMLTDQIAGLDVSPWRPVNPAMSNHVDYFEDETGRWSLGFLLNERPTSSGRPPGSVFWAGLANTYFWIDPATAVTGVFATQVLPYGDPMALRHFTAFERAVYDSLA